jgi:hypothetical protein
MASRTRKLKLEIEDLNVDSFRTTEPGAGRNGTVHGHVEEKQEEVGGTGTYYWTVLIYYETKYETCGHSCKGSCGGTDCWV